MSRKDYQAIAQALWTTHPHCPKTGLHDRCDTPVSLEQWNFDVEAVAGALTQDNPLFNRARFIMACETGSR